MAKTGKPMLDGIGATEMLHIFMTNRFEDSRPGLHRAAPSPATRRSIVGEQMQDLPPGEVGRLAVRGPTGCRYLWTIAERQVPMCRVAGT
jgi:2-aminobenzoate-CoA ligase